MKPTSTSYSITSSMTGCVSGLSSSYCNGINGEPQTINPSELTLWRVIKKNSDGTVDVVSDKVSSKAVYFYGRTGYQNFVGSLNTIAAQYTNSDYVQSTRYMSESDTSLISSIYGNLIAKNASEIATGYWYAGTSTEGSYWYDCDSDGHTQNHTKYKVGYITSNGDKYGMSLYYSGNFCSHYYSSFASLRPILTLKSTVKIIGGTGTSSDNYQLGL